MHYTNLVISLAKKLGQSLNLEYDEKSFLYKVSIDKVCFKEQYLRKNIFGIGFTIEDASYQFFMRAKGGFLVHMITDQEIEVI